MMDFILQWVFNILVGKFQSNVNFFSLRPKYRLKIFDF